MERRSRWAGPLLGLVSLLLVISAGELALRAMFGAPRPWRFPQERFVFDENVGHWLVPNQRAYTIDQRVETSSIGLRDRDYEQRVPPGVRRVLAIGDSQTFGVGVAETHTWPRLLDKRLNASDSTFRWEVVNAGIPATDTWQHGAILDRSLRSIEIDHVLLAFYINDVSGRPAAIRDWMKGEGDRSRMQDIAYLLRRSALFCLVERIGQRARDTQDTAGWERALIEGGTAAELEAAWSIVEESIQAIKRRARQLGIGFQILVLPRSDQVTGAIDGRAYNDRVLAIAEANGIEAVDLLPVLREAYGRHQDRFFVPWDGHNDVSANTEIAKIAARAVLRQLEP